MTNTEMLAFAVLGSALLYAAMHQDSGTAGDDESDVLSDGVDTVTSMITGWPGGSAPYRATIEQAAADSGVPVSILAWLLWKESRYLPQVIDGRKPSRVGALGIAQFMPATAQDEGIDPLDPNDAIPGAANYLAKLYRATGTWAQALAAYNWGLGNVRKKGLGQAPAETVNYYTDILDKANQSSGGALA